MVRVWCYLLILGWAVPALASAPDVLGQPGDPTAKLAEAKQLLDTGRLDEALAATDAAIQADPNNPKCFAMLGRVQLTRGDTARAQLAFSEAARLDPHDMEAAVLSGSLTRKAGVRAYAEGVEAFNHRQWGVAAQRLELAIRMNNLPPEHMAIAQQDLIIARFSQSRVADQIRAIQQARKDQMESWTARRITFPDAEGDPVTNGPGNPADFVGRVAERRDVAGHTLLWVATRESSYNSPSIETTRGTFLVMTPYPLAPDPRTDRGAIVEVRGHPVDPPSGAGTFGVPRVAVAAEFLDFSLDGGRGLAGPLRIDFLKFNEEQRANLTP